MKLRIVSVLSALALAPLLLACPADDAPPGTDEAGTESDTAGEEAGTDSTTGTEAGSEDQGTDTSESAGETANDDMGGTAEETTAGEEEETTTEGETGVLPEEVLTECEAACALLDGCELPFSIEECVEECVDAHADYINDAECLEAELALTSCIAGLTCEEFLQFTEGEPVPYPCMEEEESTCEGGEGECIEGVGVGENPGDCVFSEDCDGDVFEVSCADGEGCTCSENGEAFATCADDAAVCAAPGDWDLIDACCFA